LTGRSRARSAPAGRPVVRRRWRSRESLWLLAPLLGGGCFSGISLVVVGVWAARRSWWICGVLYAVTAIVGFVMIGEADLDTPASDWGTGIWLGAWLATIVHAVLINDEWRQRAEYTPRSEQESPDLQPPPKAPKPRAVPAAIADAQAVADDILAGGHSGAVPGAASAATGARPRLDLNSATVEQLADLPGMSRRVARRVVREREARGGFLAVADIVDVAELAPHEYAPLRDLLTCVPRQPPDSPSPGLRGRVVDV